MKELKQINNRNSSIELLRIISIFLILVVHADFGIIGEPTSLEVRVEPISSATRIFFEMLSIICVNIFVFISGWFGIKFSGKGICKLFFQILFIQGLLYVLSYAIGHGNISIFGLFMFDRAFWFIKAYVGLMILSPIINTFVKYANKRTIEIVLIAYFSFQTVYAWLTDGAWFLNTGYCITSLSALYLLARYIRVYTNDTVANTPPYLAKLFTHSKIYYLGLFLIIAVINTAVYILSFYLPFGDYFRPITIYYTNPFIILQSVCLFMFFLKVKMASNKFINRVAASSFAVFILHSGEGMNYYRPAIEYIYSHSSGLLCVCYIFIFMVGVYVLSILVDQPRKYLWEVVSKYIMDRSVETK